VSDEAALRALHLAGERDALVTALLQRYGREILSYLLATLRGEGEAGDAFSQWSFNVWQASATFRGEASFRTWCYALARHAVGRVVRERGRQRRHVALSGVPELEALVARVRTETLEILRTGTRDRVSQLRDELDADDQTLLILRVDRGFSWPEVARVMHDEPAPLPEEALTRRVASLRKRFERLKERLRRRALELG
jgi:RNA polymerase sigma-70 factor, ECF subfamily